MPLATDNETRSYSIESDVSLLQGQVERLRTDVDELRERCRQFPIDLIDARSELKKELYKDRAEHSREHIRHLCCVGGVMLVVYFLGLVALLTALEAIDQVRDLSAG